MNSRQNCPLGDRDRLHRPQVEQELRARVEQRLRPAEDDLDHERDRDRDEQGLGDADPTPQRPSRALAELATGLLHALGALEPDRRGDHAVRADRALAPGAVHARRHVGVPVAHLDRGRGRGGQVVLGHGAHPTGASPVRPCGFEDRARYPRIGGSASSSVSTSASLHIELQRSDDRAVGADQEQPRLGEVAVRHLQPVQRGLVQDLLVVVLPDLDVDEHGPVGVPAGEILDHLGDRAAEPADAEHGRREHDERRPALRDRPGDRPLVELGIGDRALGRRARVDRRERDALRIHA